MKKRCLSALILTAMMSQAIGMQAYAGWEQKNDGQWTYTNEDGSTASGWIQDQGKWYYIDPSTGCMRTGWFDEGTKRYYLSPSIRADGTPKGAMLTGFFSPDDAPEMYQADESGALIRNKLDEVTYNTEAAGYVTLQYKEDGKILYCDKNTRALQNSWHVMYEGDYQNMYKQEKLEENEERINEKKNKIVERYYKSVYPKKGRSTYSESLNSWKNQTKKTLLDMGQPESEISLFISEVLSNMYEQGYEEYLNSFEEVEDEYDYND